MRKLSFALLVISTILIISSCMVPKTEIERLVPPNDATEDVIFAAQSSNGVYSANLIVGADTVIGRIDYWVDNDRKLLHIDFSATEDGWLLNETRVATALTVADLPRSPGSWLLNPKLFPNYNIHNPGELVSKFVISLESLEANTTKIYFSAYAEASRKENKYFSQIGITAPCIYFAIVYTEPVVELRPILKVDVEGEVDLSRVTDYDWEITKEASPEVISNLKQGDSASVEYTLTATRLTPAVTDTYTLTGIATMTNEGSLQADQVGLKAILLGKNGGSWVEVESKTLIETSSNTTIAAGDLAGIGKPFAFEFNPGDYSEVRILAEATDNWPEIVDDFEDHLIPISPSSQTFVDESASVIDMPRNLVEFENFGFSVDHTGTWPWSVSPWVLNNMSGGTKKYSIVITNVNAPLGSYTLTNDATLTENDTLTKREDFARVLVSTPEPQEDILTLEATVTGFFRWDREIEYDWEIEKSVSPETIYLGIGEDADVTYTVNATRTLTNNAADTFSYTGAVEVGNSLTSNLTASGVSLTISLLESSDGGTFAVAQTSTQPIVDLAPGDKVAKSFDFSSYSFVTGYYYRVKAEVVSGVVSKTNTGALAGPISPNLTEYDMTATVNDAYMVPVGFDVTPDSDYVWPWLLSETTAATTYTFKVFNKDIETGEFKVPNTVTLVEDDTKQERSNDATVTILVPENNDLDIENEHDMEWDQTKEYSWEIEKSAVPESIELNEGEDGTFAYTILATRTLEETNIATLTGLATVTNTGNVALTNINVEIVLKDADGVEIGTFTDTIATLATGAEKGFPYSFTFDPTSYKAPFKVVVNAIDGASDSLETTQTVPSPNVTEIDENAYVQDTFDPFSVAGLTLLGNQYRDWQVTTASWTQSYSVSVANSVAAPGQYSLHNTAVIYGEDTDDEYDRDDETVTIKVDANNDLEIANEHDMEWDQTKEYSWIIDKSVTPQSLTLGTGDSGTFNYTLVATRSVEETNIATLTGVATVSNTGNTTLSNIAVSIVLKDFNGSTIKSYNTIIISLAPGNEQTIPYSFKGFNPGAYAAPFKVVVNAIDGASDSLETTQTVPTPVLTEIDENAYVEDAFDPFSVAGLTLSGNIKRDWQATTASWTQSYSVLVSNTGAVPGQYYLHNIADIFGKDTDTKYDTDDETVTIIVPDTVTLEAEVEAEFFWNRSKLYSWEIDKEVNPTSITYDVDEFEKEIDYTITATRTLESDVSEHSYQGAVTVTNSGLSEAQNVKLLIELQYYNGTNWITIETLPQVSLGNLASGLSTVHGFGPSLFTPVDASAEHRIVVVASADAPANTADDSYSSMLQITNSTSTNATATLDDEFTYIPEGFQIVGTDPDPLPFPMELTDSAVIQFSITLRKFSFDGSGGITYVMGLDSYISATVSGYMEGTYPGWCTEVNVPGIEGPYTILDVYEGGAPSTQMARINYILNRFRDGDYPGVDYRHIQIAIWTIMEGSINWSSWRTMFNPDVPDGDKSLVETIIDTADEDFLPGCGDVILISALSSNKQNLILEAVLPCEVQEFTLENTATLVTGTDELWDDAVVEIKLTPTDPQVWKEETAWGGDYHPGAGATWWYYFDTQGPSTQDIYAGQKKVEGASVTYKNGKLTIVLGPNMRLQSVSDPVKIQGYAEGSLPSSSPAPGKMTIKGSDLVISVSPARYYAIHLDVEVKQ
ncbi:hypothetical protein V511_12445 [Mesotoga sp. Brook.08.YT.4.2.5.1]|uniref:FxLYD domain-containing protein n=1 Tax=unclassified Mesotoga TaxID=1184398 RepID=UPI000C9AF9D9|nr:MULTISPECIES: FxLYD domain-containing protein [unclassified Mesotoga]PNE19821.1 hypothetical protein V511_12445 [Mesotoga sp. Brook.08.YT.4.2.5.1]RAO96950.1 hypothetical protein M388_12515 [Mesotoga sp. Brook.08.YT.4.2.5.4.]RDI94325.1 hypothetical protein Q502_00785 [Mesotoga sp. Brook.08.YT.4.2.5.2.]